ncbi:MAG: hypothetical protein HY919_01180 [Elusimicrobia bacterium]|nr:hypothetical protein [Elusimicrobiota bacterium]
MSVIAIPRILREKLSDEGADALVEIINKADGKNKEDVITIVEEKFERRLAEEIGKVRAEIIKWMFIFIFGQFWAIVGVLFVFFRK